MFDKEAYWKNREAGKRGQGDGERTITHWSIEAWRKLSPAKKKLVGHSKRAKG